jgi:hypothetical protein
MDESEVLIISGSVKGLAPAGRVEHEGGRGGRGWIRNYQVSGQQNILRRGATRRMSAREIAAHPEFGRGVRGQAAVTAYNNRQTARRNPIFNRPAGRVLAGAPRQGATGPTANEAIVAARRGRGRAIRGRR